MASETKKPSEGEVGNGFNGSSRVEPDLGRGGLAPSQPLPDLWPDQVEDVLEQSIERIVSIGFPDARISMVISERDGTWVLPKVGRGMWRLHHRSPHGRLDAAQGAPEMDADRYAIPLLDDTQDTIAIVEVRVDSPNQDSDERLARLEQLAATIALALTRAIQTEELKVARELDDTLLHCFRRKTVERAAHHFAVRSLKIMGAHSLLIRLTDKKRKFLRLITGYGDIFDAAPEEDRIKPLDDDSPTAEAFRHREPVVINDVSDDDRFRRLRQKYAGTDLGKVFNSVSSVACFPIRDGKKVYGVVSVYSRQPFYFTRSCTRSIADVSCRLAILLVHLREKEAEQRNTAELDFLLDVKPPLEGAMNLYKALRQQVEKIRHAMDATVVSCFLLDTSRNRFVLRAQAGWTDGRWLDAAWYAPNEGVVGHAAKHKEPQYVPDIFALRAKLRMPKGKYDRMMFNRELTARDSCELIYLPLHFNEKLLGVVAIYRLQAASANGKSGFRTTSPRVLREAASTLSAFITALDEHDSDRWAQRELRKRQAVMQHLLTLEKKNLRSLLAGFAQAVIRHYHFHYAAVYLLQKDGTPLLRGHATREEPGAPPATPTFEVLGKIRLALETGVPQSVRVPVWQDQTSPQLVKWEDTVREIFIPFKVNADNAGVLWFNWRGLREPEDPYLLPRHDQRGLVKLAKTLEREIQAHQLLEAREKTRHAQRAVDGMSLLLRQNFHRLANSVADVQASLERLGRRGITFEQRQILKAAEEAVQQQSSVFESVRTLSGRLANSRERDWYPIDTLLSEALSKYSSAVTEKDIHVDSRAINNVWAHVDAMQILECFQNLITNAVEALGPKGHIQLSLQANFEKEYWEFTAHDNGPGIPPMELERYKNGEQPETRDPRKGLGLFMTKLYCESHGGELILESELGKGTTAYIRLPLNNSN